MRSYWMRIALGALAIFVIGMIARELINRGIGGVRGVVEGSGPISIPLAFMPFTLGGDKLGSLKRVTLMRAAPNQVTSVELEVELSDSALARGLEGCSLAANLDKDADGHRNVNLSRGQFAGGTFWCAVNAADDTALVEYGEAVFHPGEVGVPLYLPKDLVDELQDLDFGQDSTPPVTEAHADSLMEAEAESAMAIEQAVAGSTPQLRGRMVDSLRAEGARRADSARRVPAQMADSTHSR